MNFKKIILVLCAGIFLFAERNANAQSATFNYTGSLQTWTVPCGVTSATILAYGAAGGIGTATSNNGLGAEIVGTFVVTPGNVLDIMVGQMGLPNNEGSGGGGTFVWNSASTTLPMIAAGGGGGSYQGGAGGPGSATNAATLGTGPNGSVAGGVGGNGGAGGTCGSYGGGGGGAGWLSNGVIGGSCGGYGGGSGGNTPLSGGAGGLSNVVGGCIYSSTGGYGGGGASTCYAGGGGGGYNGGGGAIAFVSGGNGGGGGGSYNGGTSPVNTAGVETGNGQVVITWVAPAAPSVVGNVVSNELCNGGNNASASETVTGGSSPFTYLWTPTAKTTATATGLTAGTYTIKVTDACGNSASASVSITQPAAVAVTATTLSNEFCNGENIGSASSTVSGGTGAYTYSWTGGGTNSTVSGLTAGTYTLTVTDHNGCTGTASATITQPTALSVAATTTTNVSCNLGNNGSASSTVSGGTGAYTYSWTGGGTNSTETGLTAGTYTLTVTDHNGCTGTASATITQPNALAVGIDSTTNVLCNGATDGSATSVESGGTMPYTYLWTGGGTNYKVSGLSAGTYTLTVADANGCTGTATAIITQPAAISLTSASTPDNGSGNGTATVTASGGTSPYNYLWTPSGKTTAAISGESKGTYCCKVTDANGCKDSTCVTIKSTAGIDGITSNSSQIIVYPNPNNGQFTIKSSVGGASTVEIFNVLGEKIFTKSLSTTEGTNTIDISNQSTGVYLYRVISVTGDLLGEGKISLQK